MFAFDKVDSRVIILRQSLDDVVSRRRYFSLVALPGLDFLLWVGFLSRLGVTTTMTVCECWIPVLLEKSIPLIEPTMTTDDDDKNDNEKEWIQLGNKGIRHSSSS